MEHPVDEHRTFYEFGRRFYGWSEEVLSIIKRDSMFHGGGSISDDGTSCVER
jgi:hypothetical protein